MAREAARRLNDLFHLRDCAQHQAMHFAEQSELFPILRTAGCLRYELGTCLGPCAAFTTRSTYSRHVRAVKDFLEGRDISILHRLESQMHGASERQQFEQAAALRDKMAPIQWLRERLVGLDEARQRHSFIYPVASADKATMWYLIRQGRVCAAVPEPLNATSRTKADESVRQVFAGRAAWHGIVPSQFVDHVLLVAGWFRRRPDEAKRVLTIEKALAICGLSSDPAPLARSA
jgi:excinuclease ABC subunit C